MSKKMKFKVDSEGDVTVEGVEGFGSGCLDATQMLEMALGKSDETSRRFTEEYEELPPAEQAERIQS